MTNRYLVTSAIILSFFACTSSVEPSTSSSPQNCMIATYKVATNESATFADEVKFEYDEKGRLSKQTTGSIQQIYTYTDDTVVIKSSSNSSSSTTTNKANPAGYFLESVNDKSSSKGTTYSYDANGYLTRYEIDGTGTSVKKYIYEYTYKNGDVSERKYSVMQSSGTITLMDQTTYEYYDQPTDKLNVGRLQVLNYSVPNGGPSFTGKTNQHLVKKQTVIGGLGAVFEFTYEFDTNDLVKKAVVTLSSASSPSKRYYWFTYNCPK